MTAGLRLGQIERVGMWRLAAACAARWHRGGVLRDRHFAIVRVDDTPEPPTMRVPRAA